MKRTPIAPDIDAIHKAARQSGASRDFLAGCASRMRTSPTRNSPLDHGVCAGKIDARCGLSQSTVSAHLAALQRAGLVTSKRVGQWVFFKRNEAVIQAFLEHMNSKL